MFKHLKIIKYIIILPLVIIIANQAQAVMKSNNYIIYETVLNLFDGPVISGISCTGSATSITVTWTTDVIADGFVIYSTDSGLSNSKEQGSSEKNSTSHSINVTGLTSNTTYYYKVKSTRVNGGVTTDNIIYSCATTAAAESEEITGSGGILIIDKTDKVAPKISDIQVNNITSDSVTISWATDEDATSFVEYGKDINYGRTFGDWTYSKSHSVTLNNLLLETGYHFRVLSSDGSGNLSKSEDKVFKTISFEEEIAKEIEAGIEKKKKSRESILADASKKAIDIMNKLSSQVSLNALKDTLFFQYDAIEKLANLIPSPILSGEPRIEIGADKAVVFWQTDKEANSLVAIASEEDYDATREEPYIQVVGDAEILTREHQVQIFGLKPDTLYHYQLRSKAAIGVMGRSRDFTFKTRIESLEITNYYTQIIDNSAAVFKWVTNFESDSAIKFTPYRGNVLAVDESKIIRDNTMSAIHEIAVEEFEGGVVYEVELSSRDTQGNVAIRPISQFSTSKDDLPPEISHIKVDSTVFLDKKGKIQAVISWLTNEPATSRVYFQEGVHGVEAELADKTSLNLDYTKEHIMVFTKFKPDSVYSFRVESIDSGGNVSLSKPHTFMTPKKQESILQIIIRILEQTFGWIRKIM